MRLRCTIRVDGSAIRLHCLHGISSDTSGAFQGGSKGFRKPLLKLLVVSKAQASVLLLTYLQTQNQHNYLH